MAWRGGYTTLLVIAAAVSSSEAFTSLPASARILSRGTASKARASSKLALRASGAWLGEPEDKVKAYDAVSTAWSFSAASSILSPTRTLPVVITALTTESVRAIWAAQSACYLLVLLTIRSLQHAAEKGLLKSDTYKRLNLGIALSSAVSLGLSIATWCATPPRTASAFAPRALSAFSSVLAAVICSRVWQLSLDDDNKGASVSQMAVEGFGGMVKTAKGIFLPSPASGNTAFIGNIYRVMTIGMVLQAAAALARPDLVLVAMFGQAMSEGIGAVRALGAVLLFQSASAYSLADAADRSRLRGTTFRDLNAGFVLTFVIQASLFAVAQGRSGLALTVPAQAALTMYATGAALFSMFCAFQNVAPPEAVKADSPAGVASSGSPSAVKAQPKAALEESALEESEGVAAPAAGLNRPEPSEKQKQAQKLALDQQLAQVREAKIQSGNEVADEAFAAVREKDTARARDLYAEVESIYSEADALADPACTFMLNSLDKAIRLADWKADAASTSEISDAEWKRRKEERAKTQEAASAILASIQTDEDARRAKSDAKDDGDEAFDMADQLIAAEEWVSALAQIDVAEEKWGAAGLLGLTGKPFEQALDDLRAKVPGYSGPFSVEKDYGADATNGAPKEESSFAARFRMLAENRISSLTMRMDELEGATGQDAAGDAKSSPEEFLDYGPEDSVEYLPGDSEEPQDFKGYLDELKQKRQDRLTRRFD